MSLNHNSCSHFDFNVYICAMTRQEGNREIFFGSAVIVLLFFLFVLVFSNKPDNRIENAGQLRSEYCTQYQLVAVNYTLEFRCLNNSIPVYDRKNFKTFGNSFKTAAENRLLQHSIRFHEKAERLIKPVILQRFYYQYHTIEADDLPFLS